MLSLEEKKELQVAFLLEKARSLRLDDCSPTEMERILKVENNEGPEPLGPSSLEGLIPDLILRSNFPAAAPSLNGNSHHAEPAGPGTPTAPADSVVAAGNVSGSKDSLLHKKPIVAQSGADLLNEADQDPSWLIDKIWTPGNGMIAGVPGSNKTWFAMAFSISVVTGRPFLNRFTVPDPGAVLFISEEGSRKGLRNRLKMLLKGYGPDESGRVLSKEDLRNFHHITRHGVNIPRDIGEILEIIRSLKVKLLVVDCLRRVHHGEENSSTEMAPVLGAFASVFNLTGCSVMLIHHLKKGSTQDSGFDAIRGSGDFHGWRDNLFLLTQNPDESVTVKIELREEEKPEIFDLIRTIDPEKTQATLTAKDNDELLDLKGEILALLKIDGPMSLNKMTKDLKHQKARVGSAVRSLQDAGKVKREETGFALVPDFSGTTGNQGNHHATW